MPERLPKPVSARENRRLRVPEESLESLGHGMWLNEHPDLDQEDLDQYPSTTIDRNISHKISEWT